jgi:hypothetical protein
VTFVGTINVPGVAQINGDITGEITCKELEVGPQGNIKGKIQAQGMDPDTIKVQLENFSNGFPFLKIARPATPDQGIHVWSDTQVKEYADLFSRKAPELDLVKFVPASGAASRMFKDLFSFLEGNGNLEDNPFAKKFIQYLRSFALVDDLEQYFAQRGESLQQLLDQQADKKIITVCLRGLKHISIHMRILAYTYDVAYTYTYTYSLHL